MKMSKQSVFFIYLLERYAEAKKSNAQKVLMQWDSLELTNFIYNMYEMYHAERLENAFRDIDELIEGKI
jgi:hypothetical protein